MTQPQADEVTRILREVNSGRQRVEEKLLPLVYDELHKIAQAKMATERPGHTLQATGLVHEACLKLLGSTDVEWANRAHFFFAAAEAMRRILIDHARRRGRKKRGGDLVRVPLDVATLTSDDDPGRILALDEAIRRLEQQDERMAQVVHLRFFVGLSIAQAALTMGISERAVKREWAFARAWLYRALRKEGLGP